MHTACRDGGPISAPIFPDSSIAVLEKTQRREDIKDQATVNHNGKLDAPVDRRMLPMARLLSFPPFQLERKISSWNSADHLNESLLQ